jgi:hypothetical protein
MKSHAFINEWFQDSNGRPRVNMDVHYLREQVLSEFRQVAEDRTEKGMERRGVCRVRGQAPWHVGCRCGAEPTDEGA